MINQASFLLGSLFGFSTSGIICLLSYLDKKSEIKKNIVREVEEEINSLEELSDEDFYYKYFNEIRGTRQNPVSASIEETFGLYREKHYRITLSGLGFGVLRSVEFDARYYGKDEMRKIIDRALGIKEER